MDILHLAAEDSGDDC